MAPYALFYHISHADLAAAVVRSKNTNTECSYMNECASPLFQAVVPSALRPEHVRLQTSATDYEPCLTPAHNKSVTNNASVWSRSSTHRVL